jgi:flagellar hook assembly protein FlgD
MIPFSLPRSGAVTLRILDITGREVRTLVSQVMTQGEQLAKWDGRNNQGELVPTGIYLYQLKTADIQEAQRLVRIRN